MNKNYIRGRNTEYRAKKELEELGYFVTRSSGSHSKADVVAISNDKTLIIQLKRTKSKYFSYKQEIEEIKQLPCHNNCEKWLWIWQDRKGWIKKKID
jgi:Holliday junction resolvase